MMLSLVEKYCIIGSAIFLGLLLAGTNLLFATGKWSINSGIQFTKGNYIFENSTSTYYFNSGIRYKTDRWNISANIPVIGQNSDLVSNTSGTFLPTGHHGSDESIGSHHGGGMMNGGHLSNFHLGLGDLYLYGEYRILAEEKILPYVSGKIKLKIPTAGTANNFGTGELDYGFGFTFRKAMGIYVALIDLGYWNIGAPKEIDLKDSYMFGSGVGRFFDNGRYALMLYFEAYSKILSDYEANRQLSLGMNYRISSKLIFTVISSAGLSETSPDFSFSSGIEWSI